MFKFIYRYLTNKYFRQTIKDIVNITNKLDDHFYNPEYRIESDDKICSDFQKSIDKLSNVYDNIRKFPELKQDADYLLELLNSWKRYLNEYFPIR